MTSQLSLIHSVDQAEPTDTAITDPAVTDAPRTNAAGPSPDRSRRSGHPVRAGRPAPAWRLDRRTIDRGRVGVAAARAELRGAAARATERDRRRAEARLARLGELVGLPGRRGPLDPGPADRAA